MDQPGKERTTYAAITLLRIVSKPVKITKLLKNIIKQQSLTLRLPGSWSSILESMLMAVLRCSPDDLYTSELLKTANLQYNFNPNSNKSVHHFSFQFLCFASKILVRSEFMCIAAKHSLKANRYESALHSPSQTSLGLGFDFKINLRILPRT